MACAAPTHEEFGLSKAVLKKYTPATWTDTSFVNEPQLIDLTASCQEYKDVLRKIKATMPTISISRIQRVQNSYLWGAYLLKKAEHAYLQEMKLFHATAQSNISSIVSNNFDWRRTVRSKFGKGVSFSPSAAYADKYCNMRVGIQRALILTRVLVGRTLSGSESTEVPVTRYDTTTGNYGQVHVKYGDNEFYPEYVAYYANSSYGYQSGACGGDNEFYPEYVAYYANSSYGYQSGARGGDNEFYPEYVAYYANSSYGYQSGACGGRSYDNYDLDLSDYSDSDYSDSD